MSVIMEVGKPLEGNRVEVNANYDGAYKKKFSVEKEKADTFVSSYKSTYNKISLIQMVAMCLSGGLSGIAGGHLAKNLSGWKKWGAIALGGLVGWTATALAITKPIQNMEKGVIDKFGAEVIKPEKPTNV